MATQTCWRCISKVLSNPSRPIIPQTNAVISAAFSTTTPLAAKNPPPKGAAGPSRGSRTLKLSKKKREDKGRPVAPGERKALRKRIVLSNTNAFEVSDMKDLNGENYADKALVGTVVGIPGDIIDPLRAIEAFKATQGWSFFRRPSTLYREETSLLAKHIQDVESADKKETVRKLIVGERGTGKSVLLLQAQAMAFMKGWVVIHIPEGQELVNAHTAYAPHPDSNPVKYNQKTYTSALLSQIVKANESVLASLKLSLSTHNLPIPLQSNISLDRLAELGARDAEIAWPVFQALWSELCNTEAKEKRPPVLLSLDGLAHVNRLSEYLTPSMHFIHAHDLLLIDHFTSHLSGARTLPNGGLVLGVDSNSNRPSSTSLDLALRQSENRMQNPSSSQSPPLYDPTRPYDRIDERVLSMLRNVDVVRLRGFSREEAKATLEYYAKSGMLGSTVTDRLVSEKWTLAGGGVVAELERGSIRVGI